MGGGALSYQRGGGNAALLQDLGQPHDLHVFTAIGAGANIDLERASEQFGPPVIFDFLAVGAAIWAKASAFFGARHYLIPRFTVRGENTGISGQMAACGGTNAATFHKALQGIEEWLWCRLTKAF